MVQQVLTRLVSPGGFLGRSGGWWGTRVLLSRSSKCVIFIVLWGFLSFFFFLSVTRSQTLRIQQLQQNPKEQRPHHQRGRRRRISDVAAA